MDLVFRALGDPHRLKILALLLEREQSAGELLEEMDIVQSTLSHHMKILTESGLVTAVRRGKWTYYALNADTVGGACDYLAPYREGSREAADLTEKENGKEPAGGTKASLRAESGARERAEKEEEPRRAAEPVSAADADADDEDDAAQRGDDAAQRGERKKKTGKKERKTKKGGKNGKR